jgi:arginine deiminase
MKALFTYHPELANGGIIYDGSEERRAGYTIEGGDVHVLRPDLVMIGLSERSSPGAFDAMAERLVKTQGIRDILTVVLPTDRAMIHLDMIFTMVDRDHCVVYPPSFVGPTRNPVLHYRAGQHGMREMPNLFAALREVGLPLEPVFCGGERLQLHCVASGSGARVLAQRGYLRGAQPAGRLPGRARNGISDRRGGNRR